MYKEAGGFSITGNPKYWANIKDEAARILKPGGLVITLGWNSTGLGKRRGFTKEQLLVVNHGAQHNDTLALLESKLNTLNFI